MKIRIRRELVKRKTRSQRRLEKARRRKDKGKPILSQEPVQHEVGTRTRAISHGGIGAAHRVAVVSGLVEELDRRLELLKYHRPYHESDHVLNIAYNILCGGRTLDDIDLLRNDEVFLDALGVEAIPDPTTAGDFCRRFSRGNVNALMAAINTVRIALWKRQAREFTEATARIDVDGTVVPTTGECKEGMALSYDGRWGYMALVVSLANTAEPLFIDVHGANRPSHTGAAKRLNQAIKMVREAGFVDVLLRGDTDYSQTEHLDGWNDDGVRFIFGYDARKNLKALADDLNEESYRPLERRLKRPLVEDAKQRTRPPRVKEEFVRAKGYKNLRLHSEDIAEFPYQPTACRETYRMVVLRKNISVQKGENVLFPDVRYFFFITNDWSLTAEEVVFEANDRCDQENLHAQLKGGVRALHAPLNTLNANWAYMVMASLAWTLKAWMALSLPVSPRWRARHEAQRQRWLRMDFRTFRNAVINIPAQIIRSGRRRIFRFLAWKPELPNLFRLVDAL